MSSKQGPDMICIELGEGLISGAEGVRREISERRQRETVVQKVVR